MFLQITPQTPPKEGCLTTLRSMVFKQWAALACVCTSCASVVGLIILVGRNFSWW